MDDKLFKSAVRNIGRGQTKALTAKLDENPELVGCCDDIYGTLLHQAADDARIDIMRLLLERGADANVFDSKYKMNTPLHFAVWSGNIEAVDLLLEYGADINRKNLGDDSPIYFIPMYHRGGKEKDLALFFHMLERGAVLDKPQRMLTLAASANYQEIVDFMLEKYGVGTDRDSGEEARSSFRSMLDRNYSFTALRQAVENNNPKMVGSLIAAGALGGNDDEDGRDALITALEKDCSAMAIMLLDAGVSADLCHYVQDPKAARFPVEPEALATILYERTKTNVYFEHGYQPDSETFIRTLAERIAEYPEKARRLLPLVAFRFVHSILKNTQTAYYNTPGAMASFMQAQAEAPVSDGDENALDGTFSELLEMREEMLAPLLAFGTSQQSETRTLADILASLESKMRDLDARIPGLFNPGMQEEEIQRLWKKYHTPLPDDLATLYTWHNGVSMHAYDLFQGYHFLPFMEALAIMHDLRDIYPQYFFPVMQNVFGCSIHLDVRTDHHQGLLYEVDVDQFNSPQVFPGLNAYFAAFEACFEERLFRVIADADLGDGSRGDALVGDTDMIAAAFRRYTLQIPSMENPYSAYEPDEEDEFGDDGKGISRYDICIRL